MEEFTSINEQQKEELTKWFSIEENREKWLTCKSLYHADVESFIRISNVCPDMHFDDEVDLFIEGLNNRV